MLYPPSPVHADWATPFTDIHNQVGDVSTAHGYVVALSHRENSKHYLVIVTTDTMEYVVIRATAEKNVVPPDFLGCQVIVEGKVTKRDEDEKTHQVTVELEILSVELPGWAVKETSPAATASLTFLTDVPEFHGLHLAITEDDLNSLIAANDLLVIVTGEGDEKSYHVYRKDGENVIVMFRDGKCSGVQRMRRDVSGVPTTDDGS
jgi:hypothetical protein